jgi:chemotaxis protein CheD
MNSVVVGVGDCVVSNEPETILVTHALGSCIAVMVHDPLVCVAGLLHFMLPESGIDRAKADRSPFMFADTGLALLFLRVSALGAEKRRLIVTVAGGAQMIDPQGTFNVGKRNYMAMRKILWKAGILVHAEEVGGVVSRTLTLEVATGKVLMRQGCEA